MKRRQFLTSIAAVTGMVAVPAPIRGALMAPLPVESSTILSEWMTFEPTIQVWNPERIIRVGRWKKVGEVVTIEGRIELTPK